MPNSKLSTPWFPNYRLIISCRLKTISLRFTPTCVKVSGPPPFFQPVIENEHGRLTQWQIAVLPVEASSLGLPHAPPSGLR